MGRAAWLVAVTGLVVAGHAGAPGVRREVRSGKKRRWALPVMRAVRGAVRRFNEKGYDAQGYDKSGYDSRGYDMSGYDKYGYDEYGYNEYGYDEEGYDWDGYDWDGNKPGPLYDSDGDGYVHLDQVLSHGLSRSKAQLSKNPVVVTCVFLGLVGFCVLAWCGRLRGKRLRGRGCTDQEMLGPAVAPEALLGASGSSSPSSSPAAYRYIDTYASGSSGSPVALYAPPVPLSPPVAHVSGVDPSVDVDPGSGPALAGVGAGAPPAADPYAATFDRLSPPPHR